MKNTVKNAGLYDKKIKIYKTTIQKDSAGFINRVRELVLEPYAKVRTTKGMTLIKNNTDFEKAYTNFTIRYPSTTIDRDMEIDFHGKTYTIEYLNNVNEDCVELEMQCKEVTH